MPPPESQEGSRVEVKDPEERLVQQALNNPETPTIYANGFVIGRTNSDVLVIFHRNGQIETSLNMSYTTTKSLAEKLTAMITDLERATGRPIMTTEFIDEQFKREN